LDELNTRKAKRVSYCIGCKNKYFLLIHFEGGVLKAALKVLIKPISVSFDGVGATHFVAPTLYFTFIASFIVYR